MKKILIIITVVLIYLVIPVNAQENKLYLTKKNDQVYYDSKLFHKDFFMNHVDMLPGDAFTDELIIENGTDSKYQLFFKIEPRLQDTLADELLENMDIKIIIDNVIIYQGKVLNNDSKNENAIPLGDFDPSKKYKMRVETVLSKNYNNEQFQDFSYIDFLFYAKADDMKDPVEIVEVPNTLSTISTLLIGISIAMILSGVGFIGYRIYRKK